MASCRDDLIGHGNKWSLVIGQESQLASPYLVSLLIAGNLGDVTPIFGHNSFAQH